jgi:hypothetical protein
LLHREPLDRSRYIRIAAGRKRFDRLIPLHRHPRALPIAKPSRRRAEENASALVRRTNPADV